ncbi:MAG: PGPGW domain-containing protein [Ornithinimicrobium sp.]|uniref:PGPGW domain-containing protein n=1 Tax=Ornithinimicrobium sp. TaxID=1977084 RepID=UPI0026E0F763|nr:PGPGW domain-containing protein [Ornithinimicrobium sp.]MDO5739369.1 PGPGW domain-containing protein [Ornithinimicrobium sp.]
MADFATGAVKRVLLEIIGWTVLTAGLLALFLPGPGLLLTFAGLAILSTQYAWAKRWMHPVRIRAMRGAAEGVQTKLRIALSTLVALGLVGIGVVWLLSPPAPRWWPVDDRWWLFGGTTVGITMLSSSAIAVGLLIYSIHRFHGRPEALAEIERIDANHLAEMARMEQREAHGAAAAAAKADETADRAEDELGRREQ